MIIARKYKPITLQLKQSRVSKRWYWLDEKGYPDGNGFKTKEGAIEYARRCGFSVIDEEEPIVEHDARW